MCLWTSKKRCNNFIQKNKDNTWIYVWKVVDERYNFNTNNRELVSPYQRTKIKIGVNTACKHYTPTFYSTTLRSLIHGSHVYLNEKDAKKLASQKCCRVVRCKVYLKNFIAAGVWKSPEYKKSSYQAIFSKIYITKYQYNKTLEN
jgi:hypothetical protein